MAASRDAIGTRGEAITTNILTRSHGPTGPLFRPQFLGDKFPAIDFFVQLVDPAATFTPFFFVQVKTTTQGYTALENKLKVQIPPAKMKALIAYPAPTYIIGIDDPSEKGYIVAATGGATHYSSLATTFPLDGKTLRELYDEVLAFWNANGVLFTVSRFA